jgi:hypothetical protein
MQDYDSIEARFPRKGMSRILFWPKDFVNARRSAINQEKETSYSGSMRMNADQADWRRSSGKILAAWTKCLTHKDSRRSNPAAEVMTMTRYVGSRQ